MAFIKPENVIFVNYNENGDLYLGLKVKARRNINPNAKRKVDELIVLGIPKKHIKSFLKDNNLKIVKGENQ